MSLPAGTVLWKPNPNPDRITDEMWWLMGELLKLAPGSLNGGIYANKKGYHNTRAANDLTWPGNYSVRDAVDREGPDDKAAAFDWTFPDAQAGNYNTIALFSKRLLLSGQNPNDPRLDGWREFYGNADLDTEVEGYDFRYDRLASSDTSHLWHIHGSETRKYVTSFDNKVAMLSVLKGETVEEWRSSLVTTQAEFDKFLLNSLSGTTVTNEAIRAWFRRLPWQYQDPNQPSSHGIMLAESGEMRSGMKELVSRPAPEPIDVAALATVIANQVVAQLPPLDGITVEEVTAACLAALTKLQLNVAL